MASGRLNPHLTLKRSAAKSTGLPGMRASGGQGNEFRGCLDQDIGKIFEIIYKTVELELKIRIFKAFLISASVTFSGL